MGTISAGLLLKGPGDALTIQRGFRRDVTPFGWGFSGFMGVED
jgi:hypothetical protein